MNTNKLTDNEDLMAKRLNLTDLFEHPLMEKMFSDKVWKQIRKDEDNMSEFPLKLCTGLIMQLLMGRRKN